MSLTPEAWNILDNVEEKVTLDAAQRMEGLRETFKKLSDSVKERENCDLIKRRVDSQRKLNESKNKFPVNYPIKEKDPVINMDFVQKTLDGYRENLSIPYSLAEKIVASVLPLLQKDGHFRELDIPDKSNMVIVGDIHGQLPDLFEVLALAGLPSENNLYLFNGDMVDRGPHGPEVVLLIYALKVALPHSVFINRGNHEVRRMNEKYDFKKQMIKIYSNDLYEAVNNTFHYLPFGTLINKKVLVVHGGIPHSSITLDNLRKLDSEYGKELPLHKHVVTFGQRLVEDILWSDPEPEDKKHIPPHRGAGTIFKPQETHEFLKNNKLEVLIRSHQLVETGYAKIWNGDVITIFSASYYAAKNHNKGAIAIYQHNQADWRNPKIIQYYGSIMVKSHSTEEIQKCQHIDTLQRLYDLIYDHAHSLRLGFEKCTINKIHDNDCITYKDWVTVLKEILQIELDWGILYNYLVTPDCKIIHSSEEWIIHSKFLDRFQLKLDERLTEWQDDVVNGLVTFFVNSTKTVKDMFEEYDVNKDKKISYDEFWKGICKTNLGEKLTEAQCYDLMSSIDKDHNGYIDYNEFNAHFGPKFERFQNATPWLKTEIAEIAKKLLVKHKGIKQSFLIFDGDKDNRITYAEFSKILKRDLDGEKYTQDQRQEIFKYVDENASGSISYKEFKTAFEGSNAEKFSKRQNFEISAKNMIMYHICAAIRKSRTELFSIWNELDTSKEHHITKKEFIAAIQAVNVHLKNDPDLQRHALAEEQTQKLYVVIDTKNLGYIDYVHFLQIFELHIN